MHKTTRRLLAATLSTTIGLGGVPTAALAEAVHADGHQLAVQAEGTWVQEGGRWTFWLADGSLATGWQLIRGAWYLFDADGTMLTGWQRERGTWYYLHASGAMAKGWAMVDGTWYYLEPSGAMATGWIKPGSTWYYLDATGAMATGWLRWGDAWYYLRGSGAMATGWELVGSTWYYFADDGVMAHGTEVDGYWLREDGAWDESAREDVEPQTDYAYAELSVVEAVDPAATEARVLVKSDLPFAEGLTADTVELELDLQGYEVTSVERTTPTQALVTLKGELDPAALDEEQTALGVIYFTEGSFADAAAVGAAAVDIVHVGGVFCDTFEAYQPDGSFVLSVDTGSAQLLPAAADQAFSCPANPAIRVTDARYDAWGREATLTLHVPGATPYEQFVALDKALTDGGIRAHSTTIGDTDLFGESARSDALAYVAPSLSVYVERGDDGRGYRMREDGGADIDLVLRLEAESGWVDVSQARFAFGNEGLTGGAGTPVDDNRVALCVQTLDARELARRQQELGFEDLDEMLGLLVYEAAAQAAERVAITGGVYNGWNVPLPGDLAVEAAGYNVAGLGEGYESEAPLETQGADASADAAADENARRAAQALKMMGDVLMAMGHTVSGVLKGDPGAVLRGIGLFVTMISNQAGATNWTINDVMKRVMELDSKMDAMTAQLGNITAKLDRIETSLDYKTQVSGLTALAQQAMRYRPWVMRAFKATENAEDRYTYEFGGAESSVTGKAMRDLNAQTLAQAQVTGAGSTAKLALDLGTAICGNSSTLQSSDVKSFFNYTAACVNWEPETYFARQVFVEYVGSAFFYAYCAGINELNFQIEDARGAERAVFEQTRSELMEAAANVSKLIGTDGSLLASTTDRADGLVLNTVNNKLFKKSANGMGAIYGPLRLWDQQETKDVFDKLLKERDEDTEKTYYHRSSMTRSDYETMAQRQAFVRTVPGYAGATSIRKELVIVGLLPDKFYYPKSTGNGAPYDYTFITWERHAELGYALVGNTTTTWKSDAKNRYHKRTVSADMYDIDNNVALGKQEIYHYLVDYLVWPPRWKVYLYINPVFEVRSV